MSVQPALLYVLLPCLLTLGASNAARAEEPPADRHADVGTGRPRSADLRAKDLPVRGDAESAVSTNFWVHSQDPHHRADRVAAECERQRRQLQQRWLGHAGPHWQQPCSVVIYANEFAYLRHVGSQAAMTRGVCKIERQDQRITSRRLSLMADPQSKQLTALAHELTHLVLADRFPACQPPRWADEGIALLADGADKRRLHLRDLRHALAAQCCPRIDEMLAMHQYPQGVRRTTFYGQSLSLVGYLAELDEPAKVVDMIELAMDRGYQTALREIYGIASIAELERRWQSHLSGPHSLVTHARREDRCYPPPEWIAPHGPAGTSLSTGGTR